MLGYAYIGLAAGILASPHCLGMCGGFPIHIAKAQGRGHAACRLGLCMAGKAFTYAFLGALAGFAGGQVVESTGLADAQRFLAWATGAAMILFGLAMLGVKLPSLSKRLVPHSGPLADLYAHFFESPSAGSSGLLGLMMGFLPCPATMAMLVTAAGSQSMFSGMAIMLGFGLGTAPALVILGLSGAGVLQRFKRTGLRLAACLVILLGALTVIRGTSLITQVCPSCRAERAADADSVPDEEPPSCPHCEAADE